ncbi:hypothetical protein L1887_35578 [Cichorium endivia]|nr:hypothetical protein L1887_35578 [Cichorium endivia]
MEIRNKDNTKEEPATRRIPLPVTRVLFRFFLFCHDRLDFAYSPFHRRPTYMRARETEKFVEIAKTGKGRDGARWRVRGIRCVRYTECEIERRWEISLLWGVFPAMLWFPRANVSLISCSIMRSQH